MAKEPVNLLGKRFGKLVVLEKGVGKDKRTIWLCRCDCGKVVWMRHNNLLSGNSTNCGCKVKNFKTGLSSSSEYQTFHNMHQRCYNRLNPQYKDYGKRGITVCERWFKFENFISDMGIKPFENATLDRIDNSKGYSKENCRWTTYSEQNSNRRSRLETLFDRIKNLTPQESEAVATFLLQLLGKE